MKLIGLEKQKIYHEADNKPAISRWILNNFPNTAYKDQDVDHHFQSKVCPEPMKVFK